MDRYYHTFSFVSLQAIKWKPLSHDAEIEAIQMYPKIHRLFQDSLLFLHCLKKMRSKMAQQTGESGDEALAPVYGTISGKISV